MTTLARILGLALVSLFVLLTSCSSDDSDPIVVTPPPSDTGINSSVELTTYFESLVAAENVPGFAVTVVHNDAIAYQNGVGLADIQGEQAYTNDVQNGIASVSKTFVAAATVKAMEQGHFTLDTPINDILPVEVTNLKQPETEITVRHLVTHTSGFLDNPEIYIPSDYFLFNNQDLNGEGAGILLNGLGLSIMDAPVPLADYLAEYFVEDGDFYGPQNYLDVAPGSTWAYSNVATSLMGFVIETATEMTFSDYVEQYIFAPLQMTNTTYDVTEVDFSNYTIPYLNNNTHLPFYGNHGYPEGGIHSNNVDMGAYLLDMVLGIKGQSALLFPTEYYELLFTEQLGNGIVPPAFADNHGIYWYTKNGNWMHGGNSLGISSYLEINGNGSYGFVITSNIDGTFVENENKWENVKAKIISGIKEYLSNN